MADAKHYEIIDGETVIEYESNGRYEIHQIGADNPAIVVSNYDASYCDPKAIYVGSTYLSKEAATVLIDECWSAELVLFDFRV